MSYILAHFFNIIPNISLLILSSSKLLGFVHTAILVLARTIWRDWPYLLCNSLKSSMLSVISMSGSRPNMLRTYLTPNRSLSYWNWCRIIRRFIIRYYNYYINATQISHCNKYYTCIFSRIFAWRVMTQRYGLLNFIKSYYLYYASKIKIFRW